MDENAYGLWPLVVMRSAVLVVFAASFFHPKSRRIRRLMRGAAARAGEVEARLPDDWQRYAIRTPRFIPGLPPRTTVRTQQGGAR